jgi:hypothetical protein
LQNEKNLRLIHFFSKNRRNQAKITPDFRRLFAFFCRIIGLIAARIINKTVSRMDTLVPLGKVAVVGETETYAVIEINIL